MDDIRGAERGCHFTYRCDGPGSPYNRANGYSYEGEVGKEEADARVERSVYMRAVGYS